MYSLGSLRGHVKKLKKSKTTLEVGGWVKCPIGNLKSGKHIFIHYFIRFLGEHSNVGNVINAPLCLDWPTIMSILCRLTILLSCIKTIKLQTACIDF